MESEDAPKKKSKARFLGRGVEIIVLERKYRPYDLASLLESVMVIEATSSRLPSASSNAIEDKLGMVKRRPSSAGVLSSGRIAKSRRGDNGLDPRLLQRVMRLHPGAFPWWSPLIWELIRCGQMSLQDEEARYSSFSARVHKLLHVRTMLFGTQRVGAGIFRPVTLHHLRCLVAIGTLDAIAALWMLLIQAEEGGDDTMLMIARHIPSALAMFYRRPEGQRTAVLLFARLRQLILDRIRANGYELSMCRYDLVAMANKAVAWPFPEIEMPFDTELRGRTVGTRELSRTEKEKIEQLVRTHSRLSRYAKRESVAHATAGSPPSTNRPPVRKGGLPEVPGDVVAWIESSLAPLRRTGRRSAKAAKWAYPARAPLSLINPPHPSGVVWGEKAIAKFKEELGEYVCQDDQ